MSDPRWLSDAADAGRRALRQALDESPPFAPSDVPRRRVAAELARSRARRQVARRWFIAGAALASVLTAVAFVSTEQILNWRPPADDRARPPALASAAPAAAPTARSRPM